MTKLSRRLPILILSCALLATPQFAVDANHDALPTETEPSSLTPDLDKGGEPNVKNEPAATPEPGGNETVNPTGKPSEEAIPLKKEPEKKKQKKEKKHKKRH